MYISDTDKKSYLKIIRAYLVVSAVSAVFGAVYELFSHNVYSYYMIFAFLFPLLGGAVPFLLLRILKVKRISVKFPEKLYHSGIAALTVGSIINGVLEIYGTTNSLSKIYWYAGAFLSALGIISFFSIKLMSVLRNTDKI